MAEASEQSNPEELISKFKPDRILNQDQAGRRIILHGHISSKPSLLILERTVFPSSLADLTTLTSTLSHIKNIGHNDIYAWFLASSPASWAAADIKLNLIHPCTDAHVKKYSQQGYRVVTETTRVYREMVRGFMQQKREGGRLDWVWNVLEGRAEQEDVLLRVHDPEEGFLMAPDLNWDRKTISSLHLLALVERRDIWSLRDLRKKHVPWLEHMRRRLLEATVKLYPDLDDEDQLKLYVHYHPTYYHFHIHIVNVALEAGVSQAIGKAFGLENIIAQLKSMGNSTTAGANASATADASSNSNSQDNEDIGMADIDITYTVGEASELCSDIFLPLKREKEEEEQRAVKN